MVGYVWWPRHSLHDGERAMLSLSLGENALYLVASDSGPVEHFNV